jgi:hypothetical protein
MMSFLFEESLSWGQFLQKVFDTSNKVVPLKECSSRKNSADVAHNSDAWDRNIGWEGACRLVHEGWHDGLRLIEPLIADLRPELSSMIETVDWNYDVDACQLDVARYLEGEPECWLVPNIRRIAGQGKLIRVQVGGFLSAVIHAKSVNNAGAAVLSLVSLIEQAGHSTQVEWVLSLKNQLNCSIRTCTIVTVKEFGESLNLSRLAFVLAHPGMFRRIGFSYMEQMPREAAAAVGACIGGGYYGTYFPLKEATKADIQMDLQNNPSMMDTLDTSKRWIVEQLQNQGIELKKGGE